MSIPGRSCGIGLRSSHYAELLRPGVLRANGIDFVEAISENFLGRGGRARAVLERVRADVPVVLHGVGLSLGGVDAIARDYLDALKALRRDISAAWLSDHLSFGSHGGHYAHDLWPLPFTEECIGHVSRRIRTVQDMLGERILVENISSYVEYRDSTLSEAEFVCAVLDEADCDLLLDVNNVYVSAENHGFSASAYLQALPRARVRQVHLAGHLDCGDYLLDDHGRAVSEPVWALYREACARFSDVPTLIEWDGEVPPLSRVAEEAARARTERMQAHAEVA